LTKGGLHPAQGDEKRTCRWTERIFSVVADDGRAVPAKFNCLEIRETAIADLVHDMAVILRMKSSGRFSPSANPTAGCRYRELRHDAHRPSPRAFE